jgi:hypothetical protein
MVDRDGSNGKMTRPSLFSEIFVHLDLETQLAIQELEERGLVWGTHFGFANAQAIRAEMNKAFNDGKLYEWMRWKMGVTGE